MITKFRYQAPPENSYRVGPLVSGVPSARFSSIQAAIDQAVADGHTSNNNPAFIEIYFTDGGYGEDLTLAPGVHLIGVDPFAPQGRHVIINGAHTYSLNNGLGYDENSLYLEGITLGNGGAATPTLIVDGADPGNIVFSNTTVFRAGLNDGEPCLRFSNTSGNFNIDSYDSYFWVFDNGGAAYVIELNQNVGFTMYGNSRVDSQDASILANFLLNGGARVNIRASGSPINGQSLIKFDLQGAACFVGLENSRIVCEGNNAVIVQFNSFAGSASFKNSVLEMNGTDQFIFDADPASGSTYEIGGCTINSSFINNVQAGQGAISPVLFPNPVAWSNVRFNFNNAITTCFVGNGGFASIQEAISFLNDPNGYAQGGIIEIGEGYGITENLNLTGLLGPLLICGDSSIQVTAPTFGGYQSACTITGNHTYDNAFNLTFQNLNLLSNAIGSPLIEFTSAGAGGRLAFTNCYLEKTENDAEAIIDSTGTGNTSRGIDCYQTYFHRIGSNAAFVFDFSGMNPGEGIPLFLNDCNVNVAGVDPIGANSPLGEIVIVNILTSSVSLFANNCNFGGESKKYFDVGAATFASFERCKFDCNAQQGTGFFYSGATNIEFKFCHINFGFEKGSVMARDGVQADALITQTSNIYPAGSGYNINGSAFRAGDEFVVGIDENATALAIQAAIQLAWDISDANIQFKIYSRVSTDGAGNDIELYSENYSAASNAFTLGVSDVTEIQFLNGGAFYVVAGDGKAWTAKDAAGDDVYFWYNTGTEADPGLPGTGFEVTIGAGDTADQVAAATDGVINGIGGFWTSSVVTDTITVSSGGELDATDVDAGISILSVEVPPATFTPWANGANGAGGSFTIGACTFGADFIQDTITVGTFSTTPVPV